MSGNAMTSPVEVAPSVLDSSTIANFALSSDPEVLGVSVGRILDVAQLVGWSGTTLPSRNALDMYVRH